jgi:hypothetical protein
MSDQQPVYGADVKPPTVYVEKWVTFTLRDGTWDLALWANGFRPLTGKVFKLQGYGAGRACRP